MSTNNDKQTKGERITGRKASAERYIPFYEFLLFDPKYRELSDKAKILYTFLRNKSIYSERKTEEFEIEGEGTRSYRDDQGDIFVIADNTELSVILQCHINRVPTYKKELVKLGLLDEIRQFRSTNRLYILIPQDVTDRWLYIEEMKEKRAIESKKNKDKKEKYAGKPLSKVAKLQKEIEEEKSKKVAESQQPVKNSQNVSSYNSQNVSQENSQNASSNNSQNVRQIKYKSIKGTIKGFKSTLNKKNLSIIKDIEKTSLPMSIQKTLSRQIDKLIKFKLDVFEIELHFNSLKEIFTEVEYNYVLSNLLEKMVKKPDSLSAVLNDWLERNRNKKNSFSSKEYSADKNKTAPPVRVEIVPDWLKKQKEDENKKVHEPTIESDELTKLFQERVAALKERIRLKKDNATELEIELADKLYKSIDVKYKKLKEELEQKLVSNQ